MDQFLPLLYASLLWEAVTSAAVSETSKSRSGSGRSGDITAGPVGHYFYVWVEKAYETLCNWDVLSCRRDGGNLWWHSDTTTTAAARRRGPGARSGPGALSSRMPDDRLTVVSEETQTQQKFRARLKTTSILSTRFNFFFPMYMCAYSASNKLS